MLNGSSLTNTIRRVIAVGALVAVLLTVTVLYLAANTMVFPFAVGWTLFIAGYGLAHAKSRKYF